MVSNTTDMCIGLKGERINVVYLWDLKPAKKRGVTPVWICIYLSELRSQNLLSSNLYFLKFHYEVIVILP